MVAERRTERDPRRHLGDHPAGALRPPPRGERPLPIGFSIHDNTVTAIVSQPYDGPVEPPRPARVSCGPSTLPDGTAGLFDPGWDVTQDRTADNRFYLEAYGLGTPFIEDAEALRGVGHLLARRVP